MADNTTIQSNTAPVVESKKAKKGSIAAGVKKPKSKPSHPPTSDMVNSAIKDLKERGGSSLLAIKKYLAANYKVDADKLSPFIKKYLKNAVVSGKLIQTKGKGASGSFKLSTSTKASGESSKKKKLASPKKSITKKPKKGSPVKVGVAKKKTTVAKESIIEKKKAEKAVAKTIKKPAPIKTKVSKQKITKPSKNVTKVAAKSPKVKKAATTTKKATPVKKGKK